MGESFFPPGISKLFYRPAFPGIEVSSAGYASVDAGIIGYADKACAPGEHRVFDGATLVEIVDEETDAPIMESGVPGRVVFTNLVRKLMPLIPATRRATVRSGWSRRCIPTGSSGCLAARK